MNNTRPFKTNATVTFAMVAALSICTVALDATPSARAASPSATVSAEKQKTVSSQTKTPWWQKAVFYEIYPRSFADSNGDGVGDLNGITSKLDYLQRLGVGALWITPCFPSPQVDFGYDISDYRHIDPQYGTLADFDKLVAEAEKRNIKILMDFVLNHSSDKHEWFIESSSSKDNPKRNWYIWRDGKNGGPPNNWQSVFGGSAWKSDPKTKQYYYHFFYTEQPDLNWRNAEVREAMYDITRFWMKRGVYGFRLDAVGALFEEESLPDNPILPGKNKFGEPNMENKYNHRADEIHGPLRELRLVMDEFPDNRVLVGETFTNNVEELSRMYGKNDEIHLPMNFFFAYVNKLSAPDFRKQIAIWDNNPAHGWPVYLFSNHDTPRHYVRYGDGNNNDAITKMLATMLLTLRGTPIMYYGEELGMTNNDPKRVEDVQDPIGKLGWPEEKGRDGERTPMQWTASANAGFTTGKPWLPVARNYPTHNAQSEQKDANSILSTYQKLIKLRSTHPALLQGSYIPLNERDADVLSYLRKGNNGIALVALNMSNGERNINFDLTKFALGAKGRVLLSTFGSPAGEAVQLSQLRLPPYGAIVVELE